MTERKCKLKAPNGQSYDCKPSPVCGDCEYNKPRTLDNDGIYLRTYDYNKIQNYIEAIRLIAEKVGTAESDCIEQLARDVGNYLYDLVNGDKND